jgi:hypothetical protein
MFWWGKLQGKRELGRRRREWENSVETGVKEFELAVDGINLAQDGNKRWAVVNTVMNLRVTCSADSFVVQPSNC